MRKLSSEKRFLMITAVMVALLGIQAVRDLLPEKNVVRAAQGNSLAVAMADSSRAPASLPSSSFKPARISAQQPLLKLDWNCSADLPKETTIKGLQLRLVGKACGGATVSKTLSIMNETNGFTASVFMKSQNQFETDLIQLHEGVNRLKIQSVNSSGRKTEVFLSITATAI